MADHEFRDVTPAAGPLWRAYGEAIGLELLKETFGDHWPPTAPRLGERVFAVVDPADDRPLGWVSLTRNQFDPTNVHMSRGVWPTEHGRSLGRAMRAFAEDWCRANGCDSLQIEVHVSNWQHLARVMADDYWDIEGASFNPASFTFSHEIK